MKLLKNAFDDWRKKIASPNAKLKGMLQREIYPMYQNLQLKRWQTEGASEENRFPRPSPNWENKKREMKVREPSKYPGGNKGLVYTGKLAASVIGPAGSSDFGGGQEGKKYHRKTITDRKLEVMTTIPYGAYVVDWLADHRSESFMKFSQKSQNQMRDRIREFVKLEVFRR